MLHCCTLIPAGKSLVVIVVKGSHGILVSSVGRGLLLDAVGLSSTLTCGPFLYVIPPFLSPFMSIHCHYNKGKSPQKIILKKKSITEAKTQ